ncbi:hypothetical protein ACFQ9X_02210 [Catenulispora yoronensis]
MAVLASAFTPVILAGMVKITDSVSDAIGNGSASDRNGFLASFSHALDQNSGLGGGPIMLIFVSVLSMIAAALLWLELIIRAAMLYVGAALATAVYAGFVDKSMWGHIRRWVGLMISIDLVKPIIVIVLSLATAVSSSPQDSFGAVLSGLAIMILSIFASGLVYRFVPMFGDEMLSLHKERAAKIGKAAITSAAFTSTAGTMRNGIAAHANRMGGAFAGGGGGNVGSAITGMSVGALAGGASAAAGIAAHTGRSLTVRPGSDGGAAAGGSGGNGGGNSPTSASRLQATPAQVVPKPRRRRAVVPEQRPGGEDMRTGYQHPMRTGHQHPQSAAAARRAPFTAARAASGPEGPDALPAPPRAPTTHAARHDHLNTRWKAPP